MFLYLGRLELQAGLGARGCYKLQTWFIFSHVCSR